MSQQLRRAVGVSISTARITGAVSDVAVGTVFFGKKFVPACRFNVATAGFNIPAERPQLPPSPFDAVEAVGNVYVVHLVGSQAFVGEVADLMREEMLVEVCGHLHYEQHSLKGGGSFAPSVLLSVERLRNTEDMLRVLHAFRSDTRELQRQLRQVVWEDFTSASEAKGKWSDDAPR